MPTIKVGDTVTIDVYGTLVTLTVTEVHFSYCAGTTAEGKTYLFDPEVA